jgi:aryl-alcohol dehydrogenase-like predicted oxidoreductase
MADVAIAWLIAQPSMTAAIIGARHPGQLKRNLRGAEITLSADTLAELDRISSPVKEQLGPNADLWNEGSDSRIR